MDRQMEGRKEGRRESLAAQVSRVSTRIFWLHKEKGQLHGEKPARILRKDDFLNFVETTDGKKFLKPTENNNNKKKSCSLIKWIKYIGGGEKMPFPAQFTTKKSAGKITAKAIKLCRKPHRSTWDATTEARWAFSSETNRRAKLVPLLRHGGMKDIFGKLPFLRWLDREVRSLLEVPGHGPRWRQSSRFIMPPMLLSRWKRSGAGGRASAPC